MVAAKHFCILVFLVFLFGCDAKPEAISSSKTKSHEIIAHDTRYQNGCIGTALLDPLAYFGSIGPEFPTSLGYSFDQIPIKSYFSALPSLTSSTDVRPHKNKRLNHNWTVTKTSERFFKIDALKSYEAACMGQSYFEKETDSSDALYEYFSELLTLEERIMSASTSKSIEALEDVIFDINSLETRFDDFQNKDISPNQLVRLQALSAKALSEYAITGNDYASYLAAREKFAVVETTLSVKDYQRTWHYNKTTFPPTERFRFLRASNLLNEATMIEALLYQHPEWLVETGEQLQAYAKRLSQGKGATLCRLPDASEKEGFMTLKNQALSCRPLAELKSQNLADLRQDMDAISAKMGYLIQIEDSYLLWSRHHYLRYRIFRKSYELLPVELQDKMMTNFGPYFYDHCQAARALRNINLVEKRIDDDMVANWCRP